MLAAGKRFVVIARCEARVVPSSRAGAAWGRTTRIQLFWRFVVPESAISYAATKIFCLAYLTCRFSDENHVTKFRMRFQYDEYQRKHSLLIGGIRPSTSPRPGKAAWPASEPLG